MTKSEFVDRVLKTYEDPDVLKGAEIEKVVEKTEELAKQEGKEVKVSISLVYKRIKRLMKQGVWKHAEEPEIPAPTEAIINIEHEETIEVPAEEEEKAPEEKPEALPETKLIEAPEGVPTEVSEEAIEKPQFTTQDAEQLCDLGLGKLADFTGWEGWKLTEEEKDAWCPKFATMVNKYAPDILSQYFPEITFAVMTLTIFGGKIATYREWKKEQAPEEEKHPEPDEAHRKPEEEEEEKPPRPKSREEKEALFREKVAKM